MRVRACMSSRLSRGPAGPNGAAAKLGIPRQTLDSKILGLPPMNQMDMAVPPESMRHVFTKVPDFTPFHALPNQIPLNEMNPSLTTLAGLQREWAVACERMDFSRPDVAGEDLLNRAIWYATRGFDVPYPGDDRVLRPSEVEAHVESLRTRAQSKKSS